MITTLQNIHPFNSVPAKNRRDFLKHLVKGHLLAPHQNQFWTRLRTSGAESNHREVASQTLRLHLVQFTLLNSIDMVEASLAVSVGLRQLCSGYNGNANLAEGSSV